MSLEIARVVVHWAGPLGSRGHLVTSSDIRQWHKSKGWRDIGYHRVIEHEDAQSNSNLKPGDLVKIGRPIDNDKQMELWERGAHTLGYNKDSYGVCVVAGPDHPISDLQTKALLFTLETICKRHDIPFSEIYCHSEINATQCPGNKIKQIIHNVKHIQRA